MGKSWAKYPIKHGAYTLKKPLRIRRELSRLRAALIKDLGGNDNLSTQQLLLLDNCLNIKGILRAIEEYIREKGIINKGNLEPILRESYLAYCNSLQRHLKDLGLDKRVIDQAPSLTEVIKSIDSKKQSRGHEEESDDTKDSQFEQQE